MPGDFNTAPQDMTPEMIKCLPDYRKSKIDLVKRLFTLQGAYEDKCIKEQELNSIVSNLTKELENKNTQPANNMAPPSQPELMIILDPPDNQELEEDNSEFSLFQEEKKHMSVMLLQLKKEIDSLNEINTELEQEKEELFVELEKSKETIKYFEGAIKEESGNWGSQVVGLEKENKYLKEKLNNIEKVMVAFRVLLNNETGELAQYC